MISVLIVDDHPVVRQGLQALVALEPDLSVVDAVGSAEEAMAVLDQNPPPDLVLTDLRLGAHAPDGIELAERCRGRVPVLLLTTHDHDRDIVRAVEAGAVGYLLKDSDPQVIVEAIRQAAQGLEVLSPAQTQRVTDTLRQGWVELSERELAVVRLVAEGASNRQIAKQLFVTEATVKTHLARAFGKLGVDSRTGAVAQARQRGLLG